jgi:hypothetical protein
MSHVEICDRFGLRSDCTYDPDKHGWGDMPDHNHRMLSAEAAAHVITKAAIEPEILYRYRFTFEYGPPGRWVYLDPPQAEVMRRALDESDATIDWQKLTVTPVE